MQPVRSWPQWPVSLLKAVRSVASHAVAYRVTGSAWQITADREALDINERRAVVIII